MRTAATRLATGPQYCRAQLARRIARPGSEKSAPAFIEPQLCTLTKMPPAGARWVHEVKFDGYRTQLHVRDGRVVLFSRNGLDWTARYPEIASAAARLPACVIDGEICALGKDGLPDFAALLEALSKKKTEALVFFAFDLLLGSGEDLRLFALEGRKRVLGDLLRMLKAPDRARIRYVDHLAVSGRDALQSARELGLEGIVSKRLDAPYRSGKSGFWTKTKCRLGQEVVIGGWIGEGKHLAALMVGAYRDGRFVYLGNVGTGFNAINLPELAAGLEKHASTERPFTGPNSPKKTREIHWLKPNLVCEIEFTSWTRMGLLRQASFKGLRQDKRPRETIVEGL